MNHVEDNTAEAWSFFEKIYCITLDQRPDRRAMASKQFAAVGLSQRVEFVVVTKHPLDQEEGIFQSHMKCIRKGIEANAQHILVFEDDVLFKGFNNTILQKACTYLKSHSNWNAFFLGCITDGSRKTQESGIAAITYRTLAHAYSLHRSFAKHIVQEKWQGIPFDELLRRHQKNFYALYPMCAFQGLAGSDNQRVMIDRMRRSLGGLPFIQKANELYQNNKIPFLLAPFIALFMVALLLYWGVN